jgi:hypothetical protein
VYLELGVQGTKWIGDQVIRPLGVQAFLSNRDVDSENCFER